MNKLEPTVRLDFVVWAHGDEMKTVSADDAIEVLAEFLKEADGDAEKAKELFRTHIRQWSRRA